MFQQPQSFQSKVVENSSYQINKKSSDFFDLIQAAMNWGQRKQELDYQHHDIVLEGSPLNKAGWVFLPCLLVIFGIIDGASVYPFFAYLAAQAGGGFFGGIIKIVGVGSFLAFELAVAWILASPGKFKPSVRFLAKILAIALVLLPPGLIVAGYIINPDKTGLLLVKTLFVAFFSLIVHALFFTLSSSIWAAFSFVGYAIQKKILQGKHPGIQIKAMKEALQRQYADFDKYTATYPPEEREALLNNISWYVKHKISNSYADDYEFTDFDPEIRYFSLQPYGKTTVVQTASQKGTQTGNYSYTVKQ